MSTNRVPHLWLKTSFLMVGIFVGEVGFFISRSAGLPWLGVVALCVGVVIVAAALWWVVRDGKRLRAAGHRPDIGELQERMRRHLKWGVVLVALSVVGTAILLAADRTKDKPVWPVVLGPVILIAALAWLWIVVHFLLPWAQRKQQARGD